MTSRNMFGGIGIFSGGVMFALIYDGILYLKSTVEMAKIFSKESTPFQPPFRPNMKMPYWSVPMNILWERHRLVEWAQQARARVLREADQKEKITDSTRVY